MRVVLAVLLWVCVLGQIVPVWANPAGKTWRTIVIDPGHGGEDVGAEGVSGLTEKELTLELAHQLAKSLKKHLGVRVVFTRDKDISIPLTKRVAIANNNKADIFISLHANADLSHQKQGLVVYVLTGQNWPVSSSNAPTIPGLVHWDLAQKEHWPNSLKLARKIQLQAQHQPEIHSYGVFAAPLLALKGASMPAVLVEVGFLSHPQEEEKLLKPEYKTILTETIFKGILEFKRNEGN